MTKQPTKKKAISKKQLPKRTTQFEPDIEIQLGIFGASIDYAACFTAYTHGFLVPKIVRDCICYIEKFGLQNVGLYRLSGTLTKIEYLKQLYDSSRGFHINIEDEEVGLNDVAGVLKLYLRTLPEPIVKRSHVMALDQLLSSEGGREDNILISACLQVLQKLPECNYFTLGWICHHLKHVVDHCQENMMTEQNIAIIFSPCLCILPRVLLTLIKFCKELYPDITISRIDFQEPFSIHNMTSLPLANCAAEDILHKQKTVDLLCQLLNRIKSHPTYQFYSNIMCEVQSRITSANRKLKECKKARNMEADREKEENAHSNTPSGYHEVHTEPTSPSTPPSDISSIGRERLCALNNTESLSDTVIEIAAETGTDNTVSALPEH